METGVFTLGLSGLPQSAQNFASGWLSEPQFVHRFASGLPHSAQNFWPEIPSVPHFVQRIGSSRSERPVPYITQYRERDSVDGIATEQLPR